MLQTMMQTVCQLVNNELISNKKCTGNCTSQQSTLNSARTRREQTDFQSAEPRQNWLSNNSTHRPKNNAADELLSYTQLMSNSKFYFKFKKKIFTVLMFSDTNRNKSVSLFKL
jgi:hypothetical protein